MLESVHGGVRVKPPSAILTPPWNALLQVLRRKHVASSVRLSYPWNHGVPLYYFDLGSPFIGHLTDGNRPSTLRYSRGFAESYDLALSKLFGECLERTPPLYHRWDDMVRASPRSLRDRGLRHLDPRRLSVFSAWQKDRRTQLGFDDDTLFHWDWCHPLHGGAKVLVPSQVVYWNYSKAAGDELEPTLRECSTHGGGGHFTVQGALVSALLEWIQRDAFFLFWLRGETPPRIDHDMLRSPATRTLIERTRDAGLDPTFLDLTTEFGIPVCACVLVGRDRTWPHLAVGASCRLDPEAAVHDALLEAGSVHHLLVASQEPTRLPNDYVPFTDPSMNTERRLAFWADPDNADKIAFLLAGRPRPLRPPDPARRAIAPEECLRLIKTRFRRLGLDAYYKVFDHEALRTVGYASVKVIAPDLAPLYYDDVNAPLGLERIRSWRGAVVEPRDFTPWPHPFP
jgi:thiazole/oxazole-forming peptide maturase SagD family component